VSNGKVRVAIAGTVGKSVLIDTSLTSRVRALEAALAALGTQQNTNEFHKNLKGLQVGDDHPQYPMWAASERITGQWQFAKPIWASDGTAALPGYTFTDDTNSGMYRLGADNIGLSVAGVDRANVSTARVLVNDIPVIINRVISESAAEYIGFQLNGQALTPSQVGGIEFRIENSETPTDSDLGAQFGMWEGYAGTLPANGIATYPPDGAASGYRWRLAGSAASGADLIFYSHNASASGTEIYRLQRNSAQMFFQRGTAGAPTIGWVNGATLDADTGFYQSADNTVNITTGGTNRFTLNTVELRIGLPIHTDAGTAAAPSYSFGAAANNDNGMYLIADGNLGFSTSGTLRFDISTTRNTWTLPHGGPNGSNTAPTWAFSSDVGNGMYLPATDTLGWATNAVLRASLSTTAFNLLTDSFALTLGASQDLSLTHDGTDSTITNITGNLDVLVTGGGTTNFRVSASTNARVMDINSNHASGPFVTMLRSGTAFGDFGNAAQLFGGGDLDGIGFCTRGTDALELGTSSTNRWRGTDDGHWRIQNGALALLDGMTAPATVAGFALIYVDTADGDLKVKFGDGTVKTLATDT
jgi:hypothetical protein